MGQWGAVVEHARQLDWRFFNCQGDGGGKVGTNIIRFGSGNHSDGNFTVYQYSDGLCRDAMVLYFYLFFRALAKKIYVGVCHMDGSEFGFGFFGQRHDSGLRYTFFSLDGRYCFASYQCQDGIDVSHGCWSCGYFK